MKKFDKEYSTQYPSEQIYLSDVGIRYDFVYTNEQGITTYKYKKTKKLFKALYEFYSNIEN